MKFAEIFKLAPRYLTMRYYSLSSYVWEFLFPEEYRKKVLFKIKRKEDRRKEYARMREIAEEATLLVFIFYIRKFFIDGSKAARDTVDILKKFKVNKLNLGGEVFSKRNKNVMRGDKLANNLTSLIDNDAKSLILQSEYASQILKKYKNMESQNYEISFRSRKSQKKA